MSYKVKLQIFEGPLDLLLFLIKKERIEIHDIPIAKVTDQYLEHLEMMKIMILQKDFFSDIEMVACNESEV